MIANLVMMQAAAYGACVNAKYLEVEKDMCKAEFETFKACVSKAVSDDFKSAFQCSQLPAEPGDRLYRWAKNGERRRQYKSKYSAVVVVQYKA